MDNPASTADLKAFGYEGPAAEAVQHRWLAATWRALRREVPSVVRSLEDGNLDRDDVSDVVAAAALRVLRNPEGVKKDSGAIDDYQEAQEFVDASQDVYFTSAELRRLQPTEASTASAFTIRPR